MPSSAEDLPKSKFNCREYAMTIQEAEAYLIQYRAMLRAWTMAVAGFSNDDSDVLYRKLEEGQDELSAIALAFPEKGYSVDMLINSRSRTWAGFASQRVQRLPSQNA
jgi:hypothetical protein